jgi:hypothetical protein
MTGDEVVRLMRDYVAAWRPADLALLPPECVIAMRLSTPEEVAFAAVTLAQCELKAREDDPGTAVLREMARTFVAAHERLRQIRGPDQPSRTA